MNISLCVQQYRLIFEMCTLSPLALKRKKLLLHLLSVCVLFKSLFSFPSCFSHKNIHSQWQESQSFLSAFSYIFLFNSMLSVLPPSPLPPPPICPPSALPVCSLHITQGYFIQHPLMHIL